MKRQVNNVININVTNVCYITAVFTFLTALLIHSLAVFDAVSTDR
jgi:hypothetical protein